MKRSLLHGLAMFTLALAMPLLGFSNASAANYDYMFEARVLDSNIKDIGRGGAHNMAPIRELRLQIVSVQRGQLRPGQQIQAELVAAQSSFNNLNGICRFMSPNKHPGAARFTLLNTRVNGCRQISEPRPPTAVTPVQPVEPRGYAFEGLVIGSSVVDIGRGGATNAAPVKRLEVQISRIQRGNDIQRGQQVQVDVLPSQSAINFNGYCRFEAPHKHPAFADGVLMLKTKVSGCRDRL